MKKIKLRICDNCLLEYSELEPEEYEYLRISKDCFTCEYKRVQKEIEKRLELQLL